MGARGAASGNEADEILYGQLTEGHPGPAKRSPPSSSAVEESLCYVCEERPATRYLGQTEDGIPIRICDAPECDSEIAACFNCGVVYARRKMFGNLCPVCATH